LRRKEISLISLVVIFPLACQLICHGPAFTGLCHFRFLIPSVAILAGIGLDTAVLTLTTRHPAAAAGTLAIATAWCLWNAITLVRLHPYEIFIAIP
jgi:hypothetical protein